MEELCPPSPSSASHLQISASVGSISAPPPSYQTNNSDEHRHNQGGRRGGGKEQTQGRMVNPSPCATPHSRTHTHGLCFTVMIESKGGGEVNSSCSVKSRSINLRIVGVKTQSFQDVRECNGVVLLVQLGSSAISSRSSIVIPSRSSSPRL